MAPWDAQVPSTNRMQHFLIWKWVKLFQGCLFSSYWGIHVYYFTDSTTPSEVGVLTPLKGPRCTWTLQCQTPVLRGRSHLQGWDRCSGHHSAGFASTEQSSCLSVFGLMSISPVDFCVRPLLCCKPGTKAQLWALLETCSPASAAPPDPGSEYPAHGTGRKTSQTGGTLSICMDTNRAMKLTVKVWMKIGPGFIPVATSHLPKTRRHHLCFLGLEMTFSGGSSVGQGCPWGNQTGTSFAEMLWTHKHVHKGGTGERKEQSLSLAKPSHL